MHHVSLLKRTACMLYEGILLFALLFVAGIIYRALFGDPQSSFQQNFFFIYSWLIAGLYFVFCWAKTGQTLAMQTWRIKLVGQDGKPLSFEQSSQRYLLASFSLMFFGLGFLWAAFDREDLYLHDRLAGGRLVILPKN